MYTVFAASNTNPMWRTRMLGTSYIHMLEGRLRIKVTKLKGSPDKAVEIESTIRELKGVSQVRANHLTGNVLVLFDSEETNHFHIIGTLKDLGCLTQEADKTPRGLSNKLTETLMGPIAQAVVERAILALI
jgi:hypothetical protein